jgi:hypothetical protein
MYVSLYALDNTLAFERKKVFLRWVVLELLEWVSWLRVYNAIDGLAISPDERSRVVKLKRDA